MPELDDNEIDKAFSEDAEQISHVLSKCGNAVAASLPPVNINEPNKYPFNVVDPSSIDLSVLTSLCFAHQTKQAASGVCTSKTCHSEPEDTQSAPKKELTDRQAILKAFSNIICEQGEKGAGTGADRLQRWTERNPAPGGRISQIDGVEAPELAARNSANAVAVADATAKRVSAHSKYIFLIAFNPISQALKRRKEIFKKFALPDMLGDGRITMLTPLQIAEETSTYGGYGIALSLTLNQFVVCKSQSSALILSI